MSQALRGGPRNVEMPLRAHKEDKHKFLSTISTARSRCPSSNVASPSRDNIFGLLQLLNSLHIFSARLGSHSVSLF